MPCQQIALRKLRKRKNIIITKVDKATIVRQEYMYIETDLEQITSFPKPLLLSSSVQQCYKNDVHIETHTLIYQL